MATSILKSARTEIDYPESDGNPAAETPWHRDNLLETVATLQDWYPEDPKVYVSGNMFLYYVEGDAGKQISPDVFAVKGVAKLPERRVYQVWKEKKAPNVVIEITSKSTKKEDLEEKYRIYQDVLKVAEYFLFDPEEEYLRPSLKGFCLVKGKYQPIASVEGRLPSKVLNLHLERGAWRLRLYDPAQGKWLPTREEIAAALEQAQAENDQLRQELEALKKKDN